jgi:tripeptide aminopeptidase
VSTPTPEALARRVVARTAEIAAVPAPTGEEAARAALVAEWWRRDGWGDVRADASGNVWAQARGGAGGAIVLAAHLDTVFPADLPHVVLERDGRLVGPSVGDDSVALAALSEVGALLAGTSGRPVWLLATTGEEGLGNLRGAIGALEGFEAPMDAFVAVEGNYLGRVSATGVGSLRWRVRVAGPGGHAWEASDAPSAIHVAAGMIEGLARLKAGSGRSAVNVGRVGGGEAINARARECWFDLDIRADDPASLSALEAQARIVIQTTGPADIRAAIEELGRRPAGALGTGHPLIRAALAALADAGIVPTLVATSTDANAAHDRGIPAVALGITTGSGEHTPQEWIDIAPIADGLTVLASTLTMFEEVAP